MRPDLTAPRKTLRVFATMQGRPAGKRRFDVYRNNVVR